MSNRSEEIRKLFSLSVDEMVKKCSGKLVVTETLDELYEYLADQMVAEFEKSRERQGPTAFIMPVGPTQPYALMASKINEKKIDLGKCVFFFMDEYCDDKDRLIPETHPLSFRGGIQKLFFGKLDPSRRVAADQIVFPAPENLKDLPKMIADAGGIEVCYGGIGIHGHLAFNEPEPGVKNTAPRIITINDFTRTIDCSRHGYGGNLINFPRRAITLGMKQILAAKKLLLMTRNEAQNFQWANTALRMAALGEPGDDYPVTHIRNHPAYIVATDRATATAPRVVL